MIIDAKNIIEKVKNKYKNPIFAVLGGSRSYGIYMQDTPYIIAGSYAASIVDESGINGNTTVEAPESLHRGPRADAPLNWAMQEVSHTVRRLKDNDLSVFEEIYSPLVFLETSKHRELKEIIRQTLSKELCTVIFERIDKKKKKLINSESYSNFDILDLARDYMQGIYLLRMKKFMVSLMRLNEYFDNSLISGILNNLTGKNEVFYLGDRLLLDNLFEFLHDEIAHAYDYSTLPETTVNREMLLSIYLRSLR